MHFIHSLKHVLTGVCIHCRHLQSELDLRCQRVSELESYVGGEIPVVRGEGLGRGVTWMDERETLLKTLSVSRQLGAVVVYV